jgi:hypothetical protein
MTDTFDLSNPKKPKIEKDPDAVLDYPFDWTDWLADIGDSIASAVIECEPADDSSTLANPQTDVSATKVTAWLGGGTVGKTYRVTCHITTSHTPVARKDDRSIFIKVKEQ